MGKSIDNLLYVPLTPADPIVDRQRLLVVRPPPQMTLCCLHGKEPELMCWSNLPMKAL